MLAEEMNRVKDGFNEATNAPTDLDLAKVSKIILMRTEQDKAQNFIYHDRCHSR